MSSFSLALCWIDFPLFLFPLLENNQVGDDSKDLSAARTPAPSSGWGPVCVLRDTLRLLEVRDQVCFLIEPDFQYQGSTVGFQILLWELRVVPLAEGEAGAKGSLREENKLIHLKKKEPRKQEQL